MIEARQRPRLTERQSVWLRPLGVVPSDWLEGIIVGVRKPWLRKCQLRIAFLAPFPYESFKAMVYGPEDLHDVAVRESPEHEQDHFWK